VLTELGKEFFFDCLVRALHASNEQEQAEAWDVLQTGLVLPRYHTADRLFTWGRHVIKHFRQPSVNQEMILRSAEELDWPDWFDDPLPRLAGINPKRRLHDTIKDLNRRQQTVLIHFKGDGTGIHIGWELLLTPVDSSPSAPPLLPQLDC
jgi:hypothetical protein